MKSEKPVLLIAFANHTKVGDPSFLRELSKEQDAIREALRRAEDHGLCICEFISDADVSKVISAFRRWDEKIWGFHFSGHADGYHLLLESAEKLERKAFADFISQRKLEFVFLNACYTRGHAEELSKAGVAAVIGTESDIYDDVARQFATDFYTELGQGSSIIKSFKRAEWFYQLSSTPSSKLRTLAFRKAGRYPWQLYPPHSSKTIDLPSTVGNPLYGLDIPEHYSIPNRPFKGLQSFEKADARIFFGRETEIRRIYDLVSNPGESSVLLVYGQSGAGKSSLLKAGLLPRTEHKFSCYFIEVEKERTILESLKIALLQDKPEAGVSLTRHWEALQEQQERPLLLILDQLEKIFTRSDSASTQELQQLVQQLKEVTHSNTAHKQAGKIILSFRADFAYKIERALDELDIQYSRTSIGNLSKETTIRSITGVTKDQQLARHYDWEIKSNTAVQELANLIADDLHNDSRATAAPVLQILLHKMWESAGSKMFSIATYREQKGKGLLLNNYVEECLLQLKEAHPVRHESGLILDLLNHFVTPYATAEQISNVDLKTQYHPDAQVENLCGNIAKLHLLSGGIKKKNGQHWRLGHDLLGPIIRNKFLQSQRPGPKAARLVESLEYKGWEQKPLEFLLNPEQIRTLQQGRVATRKWATELEELISYSMASHERQKKIRQWNKSLLLFLLFAVAILSSVTVIMQQKRIRSSEAQNLELESDKALATSPYEAYQLLRKSLKKEEKQSRLEKLHQLKVNYLLPDTIYKLGIDQQVNSALLADQGRLIFLGLEDQKNLGNFHLGMTRLAKGRLELPLHRIAMDHRQNSLSASNDGLHLFSGGSDHQIHWSGFKEIIWSSPKLDTFFPEAFSIEVEAIAYSSKSERLAVHYQYNMRKRSFIDIWERDGYSFQLIDSLAIEGAVSTMQFSPVDDQLLIGFQDGHMTIFDAELALVQELAGFQHPITKFSFINQQNELVIGSTDGSIYSGQLERDGLLLTDSFSAHNAAITAITHLYEGKIIATASAAGEIKLWERGTGAFLKSLIEHEDLIYHLAFSPIDSILYSIDQAGKLCIWPIFPQDLLPLQTGINSNTSSINSSQFINYRGDLFLYYLQRGTQLHSWKIPDGNQQMVLELPDYFDDFQLTNQRGLFLQSSSGQLWEKKDSEWNYRYTFAFDEMISTAKLSPDGQTLALGHYGKEMILMDADKREKIDSQQLTMSIRDVAFLKNNSLLVTTFQNDSIGFWRTEGLVSVPDRSLDSIQASHILLSFSEKEALALQDDIATFFTLQNVNSSRIDHHIPNINIICASMETGAPLFAAGSEKGDILLFNEAGYIYKKFRLPDTASIQTLALSKRWVFYSTKEGKNGLWEIIPH